jgi:hypothetical protein
MMDRTLDINIRKLELQSVKKAADFRDGTIARKLQRNAVNASSYYDRSFNVRTHKERRGAPVSKRQYGPRHTALSQALEGLARGRGLDCHVGNARFGISALRWSSCAQRTV